ncbi:hypothetical protein [Micromonospora sp. DT31]|uniref:hypothetical protein n=1 Tax=Micromonospora sp. DT31 TaxID=3393434 RepID=UPI003CEC736A
MPVSTLLDLDRWRPPDSGSIVAAGVDLVDTERLELAFSRSGPGLARRLFGDRAEELTADPAAAAGAFGVQESVVKLAGGLPKGGRLSDILLDKQGGAVTLSGVLADWAHRHGAVVVGGYLPLTPGLTVSWALALTGGAR